MYSSPWVTWDEISQSVHPAEPSERSLFLQNIYTGTRRINVISSLAFPSFHFLYPSEYHLRPAAQFAMVTSIGRRDSVVICQSAIISKAVWNCYGRYFDTVFNHLILYKNTKPGWSIVRNIVGITIAHSSMMNNRFYYRKKGALCGSASSYLGIS